MAITWKVAAASGAAIGIGIGGFVLNAQADDAPPQQVSDVDLQDDSISSMSSPIEVTTTTETTIPTTTTDTVAPPPTVDDSPDSPVVAPAPAPTFDDSEDSPAQPAAGGGDDSADDASDD